MFAAAVEALRTELLKKKYALVMKPRKKAGGPRAVLLAARAMEATATEAGIGEATESNVPDTAARECGSSEASEPRDGEEDGSQPSDPHAIPAAVRRAVFIRDGGQCTFQGKEGRCTEKRFIELHHRVAVAHGGESTVANVTLHCRAHNVYQAELDFGAAHMARFEKLPSPFADRHHGVGATPTIALQPACRPPTPRSPPAP